MSVRTAVADPPRAALRFRVRASDWDDRAAEGWASILERCPDASWFQTPEWMRLLSLAFPRWQGRILAAEDDSGRLRGVLPFVRVRHMGVETVLSMPFGTRGGPLVPPGEPAGVAASLCLALRRETSGWNARGVQMTEFGNAALRSAPPAVRDAYAVRPVRTLELDLAGGTGVVRCERFAAQRRRQARCAFRRGLEVSPARTREDYLEFASLYTLVARGWSSRCRLPEAFFAVLHDEALPAALLLLARHDGVLVGGNLAFLHREVAVSWCGVMCKDASGLHPAVALHEETIARACAAGCRTYDLGPSPGLPGAERFKLQFGAQPRTGRRWTALTPFGRLLERLRPALVRAEEAQA